MKWDEMIIILYNIRVHINKNKISKELKIRCNSGDVKHSTIIIQVSKGHKKNGYTIQLSTLISIT